MESPSTSIDAEHQAQQLVAQDTVFALAALAVVLATVAGIFVSIADETPSWKTRQWDDPMVITHLVLFFPLMVALQKRMWISAGIVFMVLLMSTIYHMWFEDPNSNVLDILDEIFAYLLLVWLVRLGIDMVGFRGMGPGGMRWLTTGIVAGIAALVFFYLPGTNLHDDGRHNYYNEKLHPVWHVLAFFATGAILMAWKEDPALAPKVQWWKRV